MGSNHVTVTLQVGVLWEKSFETFKQNNRKIPKKNFTFPKVAGSIHSHVFFKLFAKSLSNFVNDFWKTASVLPNLVIICK